MNEINIKCLNDNKDIKLLDVTKLISKKDIISFDIYDTLIIRSFVQPNDVFKFLEKNENIKGFYKARLKAEKKVRCYYKHIKEDITISDIYAFMNPKYKNFIDIEKKYEIKYTNKNRKIFEIYQEALKQNKKIIFTTDMYLDRKTILQILSNNGYDNFYKLYISGEIGLTKRSGHLFQYVINDLKIEPNKMLHIGDDLNNDILQAQNYNIDTYKIDKYIEEFLYSSDNKKFLEFYKKNKTNIYASILLSLYARHSLLEKNFKNFHEYLGYYIAGLSAYSYVQYINSISKNKDAILFIARDGYLLMRLYNKLFKYLPTYYINAQRILSITSTIDYKNVKQLLKIVSNNLDIDLPKNKYMFHFFQYFILFKYRKLILTFIQKNKKEFKKYIDNVNILESNLLSVDMVSAHFTSQLFLQRILTDKTINGAFFSSSLKNKHKNSFIFLPKKLFFKKYDIYRLVEYLFTSPKPPVEKIINGKIVYQNMDLQQLKMQQSRVYDIESGINKFVTEIMYNFSNIQIPQQIVSDFIYSFIENANDNDIIGYQSCKLDDGNVSNIFNTNLYTMLKSCIREKDI